jgi:uncharacterized protein YndB with AHSA1/START domain
MSVNTVPEAVRKTLLVRCSVAAAFRVWTAQIDQWWPKGHSRSGDPGTAVYLEGRIGGRLYERTPDGVEYDWGEVLVWEPPHYLAYHWYLGSSAAQPTRVDVRSSAQMDGRTQVDIVHRGPELIGDLWAHTNTRFAAAWEHVLAAYSVACQIVEQEEAG